MVAISGVSCNPAFLVVNAPLELRLLSTLLCVLDAIVCFIVITGLLTLVFILFFNCDYRRLQFEEKARSDSVSTHACNDVIASVNVS